MSTTPASFRFRFWQFGEWHEVVVDDRLPSYNNQLVHLHSADVTEFWAALLEKAYAKLYGSYEALQSLILGWTLQDLCGGIAECFPLTSQKGKVYEMLSSVIPRCSFIAATISASDGGKSLLKSGKSGHTSDGLVVNSPYLVTGVATIALVDGRRVSLVRLRHPANRGDYCGPWAESSDTWRMVPDEERQAIDFHQRSDGEFWMSFDDFVEQFSSLDLVHLMPESWNVEVALQHKKKWLATMAHRQWVRGYNAGGGTLFPDTMAFNPQFHLHVPPTGGGQEVEVTPGEEPGSHVIISLMQPYVGSSGSALQHLGFALYKVQPPNQTIGPDGAVYQVPMKGDMQHQQVTKLTKDYLTEHPPVLMTQYQALREVVVYFTLLPGDYVIIPSTQKPHTALRFLIRIFTDERCGLREVNCENSFSKTTILNNEKVQAKLTPNSAERKIPQIDMDEVQAILRETLGKNFLKTKEGGWPTDLCKTLVIIKDIPMNGLISGDNVSEIVESVQTWKLIFSRFDTKNSGHVWSYHLRKMLRDAGFVVSNKVLEVLVLRYVHGELLTLDGFFYCLAKLHQSYNRYYKMKEKQTKSSAMLLEEMILMTIYT